MTDCYVPPLFSSVEGRIRNLGLGGKIGTIWYFGTRPEFGTLLVPLGHSNPNFLLLQILVSPEKNAAQFSKTRGGGRGLLSFAVSVEPYL